MVSQFNEGVVKGLRSTDGITLYEGHARFTGRYEIQVDRTDGQPITISAKEIFINTGTRPAIPTIEGLGDINYLTAADMLELTEVPEHLMIIGGGYIGLEFAQMFRRFGSEVTVLEHNDRFLHREDEDVSAKMKEILEEDGITIITGAAVQKAHREAGGAIGLTYDANGQRSLTGSHLLIASGTRPNTDDLGIAHAGIEIDDKGNIRTDQQLRTNVEGIYALGDVKGGPAFTHISYDDFRVIKENLLHGGNMNITGRLVPYTMFTDPQLAHVGMHEKEAKEKNINVKVAKLPMENVARAIEMGETRGLMKAVVDAGSGKILGATIIGIEGGEVLSALQLAMMGGLTYKDLRDGIFSHPTLVESLNNLFMKIEE